VHWDNLPLSTQLGMIFVGIVVEDWKVATLVALAASVEKIMSVQVEG